MRHPGRSRRSSRAAAAGWASAVFGLLVLAAPAASQEETLEVAVIVHPSQATTGVSRSELERILTLRRQRWDDGTPIYLLMQEEGSREKQIILDRVYRMSGDELKRFWLGKIHRGELASFPKTLASGEAVRSFVSRVRNAIGYIDARELDASVRALAIEGTLPGGEGYALRDGPKR